MQELSDRLRKAALGIPEALVRQLVEHTADRLDAYEARIAQLEQERDAARDEHIEAQDRISELEQELWKRRCS